MSPFSFDNYQDLIQWRISQMPKGGYGQQKRMAVFLNIQTSYLSQVMKRYKNFTEEQAASATQFLGLNLLESEYFLLLVQRSRAGTDTLKELLNKRISKILSESEEVKSRLPSSQSQLTETQSAMFYSHWQYSAVRLLCSLPSMDVDQLSQRLHLERGKVQKILDFLLEVGLCLRDENGKITMGPSITHVESKSLLSIRHHSNWRQNVIANLDKREEQNLHFTSPLTCSIKDFEVIRKKNLDHISNIAKIVTHSPSEELYCFQLDFYKV